MSLRIKMRRTGSSYELPTTVATQYPHSHSHPHSHPHSLAPKGSGGMYANNSSSFHSNSYGSNGSSSGRSVPSSLSSSLSPSIRSSSSLRQKNLLIRAAAAATTLFLTIYCGTSYIRGKSNPTNNNNNNNFLMENADSEDLDYDNLQNSNININDNRRILDSPSAASDGGATLPNAAAASAAIAGNGASNNNPDCPPSSFETSSTFGGAVHPGYFLPRDVISTDGTSFKFVAITDMDKLSKVQGASKPTFRAELLPGILHRHDNNDNENANGEHSNDGSEGNIVQDHQPKTKTTYSVSFDMSSMREITTRQNEGGRGAEYSELALFDNRLLTFDDRTGAVLELLNKPDGQSTFPVPRYVLTEGNGDTTKGMKWEWATVYKQNELYIGGIGKEMQLSNGDVDHEDAMWIAIIGKNGQIRREDWSSQYNFVRKFLGCQLPGYIAHEAIRWSDHLKKWIFLPRRVSTHQYVPDLDERLGSNKVIVVNEDFSHATVIEIDLEHHEAGLRGFSSFAFVPNTQDQHVLALRSVEEDCVGDEAITTTCKFKTYICVFELLTGDVLMEEVLIDRPVKFEGIEFADIFTIPPDYSATEKRLRGSGGGGGGNVATAT